MFFVDDGCNKCGFYECRECSYRFLKVTTDEKTSCQMCEQDICYEIGPDESLDDILNTANLKEIIEGEEEVAKMDALLSCAYQDDTDSWM